MEDVIQGDEVDEFESILAVDILDVFDDGVSHIGEVVLVLPEVVEVLEVGIADWRWQALDQLKDVVAAFTAEFRSSELIERRIGIFYPPLWVFTLRKPGMLNWDILVLKRTFSLIQSAHSRAMARWVRLLRRRISKSEPYSVRSRFSLGI